MGKWRYGVVLDAGSSGTRAYVYQWPDPATARIDASDKRELLPIITTKPDWVKKIKPGVSTFAHTPERVGPDHLKPLLDHVLDVVPSAAVKDTPIFLLATAGMRLLSDLDQVTLLEHICSYFRENSDLLLPDCEVHVRVIDGETEGLYGWIAANYLLGAFDAPANHDHGKGHHTYGFLDMGGASAQIAFAPNATEAEKHANDLTLLRLRTLAGNPVEYRVFVTSWLGFGVREARNRYVKELIKNTESERERPDPCLPSGLRTTVNGDVLPPNEPVPGTSPYLVGTGKFDECLHQTVPLLDKDAPCEDEPCLLHGVHVPAIDFDVNHFVGISEYWHTTHEIFGMAQKDTAYDFHTYQLRVKEFCDLDWSAIQKGVEEHKWGKHVSHDTANEVCFKAAWIINMLHEGIGIPRVGIENPQLTGVNGTKEILDNGKSKGFLDPFQAVNKIGSTEISWTLGKAVLYASSQVPPAEDTLPVGFGSNVAGIPDDFQYPASPRLPIPITNPPTPPHTNGSSTIEQWHDALFDGDSPRRIPGLVLFGFIVLLAVFFLLGRERRRRVFRKINRTFGRSGGSYRKRGLYLLGKIPFIGRSSPSYERVLEEGAQDFELGHAESDSDCEPVDSPDAKPAVTNRSHPSPFKYAFDNASLQSVGSALELGSGNHIDRHGLVIRTESRDRLSPVTLGPAFNGRRSRTASPVRKSPLAPP
ncbi:hypothetical protein VTO42DRAFT_2058 [Malbranchea cinnamomea]